VLPAWWQRQGSLLHVLHIQYGGGSQPAAVTQHVLVCLPVPPKSARLLMLTSGCCPSIPGLFQTSRDRPTLANLWRASSSRLAAAVSGALGLRSQNTVYLGGPQDPVFARNLAGLL
jgi:hypothetical protein